MRLIFSSFPSFVPAAVFKLKRMKIEIVPPRSKKENREENLMPPASLLWAALLFYVILWSTGRPKEEAGRENVHPFLAGRCPLAPAVKEKDGTGRFLMNR